jgi:hypothetical protein
VQGSRFDGSESSAARTDSTIWWRRPGVILAGAGFTVAIASLVVLLATQGGRRPVSAGFRPATASVYQLSGKRTACGDRLRSGQLGVAHRTLPCGEKVTLRHEGETVTAPVIDRGPFVSGRDFDLTRATAQRLGFTTGVVTLQWRPVGGGRR